MIILGWFFLSTDSPIVLLVSEGLEDIMQRLHR